ncbi:MAG: hypothetical protein HYS27_03460 [Deltaproteobacteria bacterium]|nr:hypothetical protein [Deltaproteobacteria bacterium]
MVRRTLGTGLIVVVIATVVAVSVLARRGRSVEVFDCIGDAQAVNVKVTSGYRGCFGGEERTLAASWDRRVDDPVAHAMIASHALRPSMTLSIPQARAELDSILDLATRSPAFTSAHTTTLAFVDVEWTCDATTNRVSFQSRELSGEEYVDSFCHRAFGRTFDPECLFMRVFSPTIPVQRAIAQAEAFAYRIVDASGQNANSNP